MVVELGGGTIGWEGDFFGELLDGFAWVLVRLSAHGGEYRGLPVAYLAAARLGSASGQPLYFWRVRRAADSWDKQWLMTEKSRWMWICHMTVMSCQTFHVKYVGHWNFAKANFCQEKIGKSWGGGRLRWYEYIEAPPNEVQ